MKKIMLLTVVMFSVISLGLAQSSTKSAPEEKDGIKTVNLGDIREFDKKDILKKVPFAADKLVFNTYFLEPRQLLLLHKHPTTDELFFIVEGRGQFTVGDNQIMVDSGSVVYGPANISHGLVNSSNKEIVMISVQSPKPVKMIYVENSTVRCSVCGQDMIIPENAKVGDIVTCPRCHAKFKLSKAKDGKWVTTQL